MKGPEVCQQNIPHIITTLPATWPIDIWMHAFMLFTPNSTSTIWMSLETHQTRKYISNLLFPNFGELVQIRASVFCTSLIGVRPGATFCCCSPTATRLDLLCVERCSSEYLPFTVPSFWVTITFLSSRTGLMVVCDTSRRPVWHRQPCYVPSHINCIENTVKIKTFWFEHISQQSSLVVKTFPSELKNALQRLEMSLKAQNLCWYVLKLFSDCLSWI